MWLQLWAAILLRKTALLKAWLVLKLPVLLLAAAAVSYGIFFYFTSIACEETDRAIATLIVVAPLSFFTSE